MTSTTSSFIPAATRAGAGAYAPEASPTRTAGDTGETRSFEELCPEKHGEPDLPSEEPRSSDGEHATEAESDATPAAEDADEIHGEHDSADDEEVDDREVRPAVQAPSIFQTLLAGRCEIVPTASVPSSPAAASAENAATPAQTPLGSDSSSPANRPALKPGTEGAGHGASTARPGRPGVAVANQPDPAGVSRQVAGTRTATATPQQDGLGTSQGDVAGAKSKVNGSTVDPVTPATVSRLVATKPNGEKSAAQGPALESVNLLAGQNRFLSADNQQVASTARPAGTRSAMPAGIMHSSTSANANRLSEHPAFAGLSPIAAGQSGAAETLSVDWKGWTNGGGERASTAAQFSQLGEKLSQVGVAPVQAGAPAARAATPAVQAPVTTPPTVPAEAAEALAPIHSAIERLVLHGREQLALTVRFEQGGSLSLRLAMNQGEIATQIQTDVPGLEAALKSAWGELAQDWNSRGWKLANPEFTASTTTYHQRQDTAADDRPAGRQPRHGDDGMPDFGGRALAPARLKHAGVAPLTGLDAIRAAALARRGIHTWA